MLLKNRNHSLVLYYLFVIAVSILPFIPILSSSLLPHTHDGLVHLPRMAAYYKALQDGQIPVRWAGDLNFGYGLPLFNFIYQFPYIISSLFLFLGFGLVFSFKLTLLTSFLFSGVFMFLFAKRFFNDTQKALLVTVFYQFAPFRLVELLIRGSLGEVYTYTFLPFLLYGLYSFSQERKFKNFLIAAVGGTLLILSHNAISLSFFAVSFLFLLFFSKDIKSFFWSVFSQISGLFLAAFYWIPAIFEHKYTYGDLFMKDLYKSYFPPFLNFFIPNITNDSRLQTGGISVQFGLFQVIAVIIAIFLLLRRRKNADSKKIIFGLFLVTLSLFFMQPVSIFMWQHMSLLRQFQFPWRLLSVVVLGTSLLSISYFSIKQFNGKIIYRVLIVIVILSTIFYWKPNLGYDKIDESYYWNFPLNTTYFGETDVIWSAGPAKKYPKQRVEIIGGKGAVENFQKNSYSQSFKLTAQNEVQLVDHIQYFPGWRVYVDNKMVPIEFQDPNWRGEITFRIPKGEHNISVIFKESAIRFVADSISAASVVLLMVFPLVWKKIRV